MLRIAVFLTVKIVPNIGSKELDEVWIIKILLIDNQEYWMDRH